MATALYNRYRPRTFGEVVGQRQVTDALEQALRSGRLHHAYLFSGPRGCGKTSSARILAASLNCVDGPTPEPCGVCEHCVAIRSGSSVDVVEIDAASHGGVDDARDLRERAAFAPASARMRVFIVDEAHMITKEGFNALLKVVEEPPPHLTFVFATTEPEKVLTTIRSRTFHYQFGLVPPAELAAHLRNVCEAEGVTVEPAVVPLVVRVAEGSVRDSLSVLDQLLAGVGDEGLSYATAALRLGLTDAVMLDETIDALGDRNSASLFGVVERVLGAGADPRRFTTDLLERLRDLVLIDAVPDARDRGLLDLLADDDVERMRGQAARLGSVELSRAADVVHAALVEMRGTTSPRLTLELLCARLMLPGASSDTGSLLVRLERLERRLTLSAEVPRPPQQPQSPPLPVAKRAAPQPVPVQADEQAWPETAVPGAPTEPALAPATPVAVTPSAAAGSLDIAAVRLSWPQVLETVKATSRTAHALLSQHAEPSRLDGTTLYLAFANASIARRFSYEDLVRQALGDVLSGQWRVQIETGGTAAPADAPVAPAGNGRPAAADPGFGPGDEPEEEDPDAVEAPRARAHGEDDALALLRDQMGATVIGEIRP